MANSSNQIHRRALLASLPAIGVLKPTSSSLGDDRNSRRNEFRVGCLNVGSYSHLAANWAALINVGPTQIPFTGMRITHCWDIDADKSRGFAKRFSCQAVKNFDDMSGKVDGIISGGYYCHPWNHILHAPYLEAGLPNLINRPFTNSLSKARRMIDLARKSKATILVPSAFEHNSAIVTAKAWASDKQITSYHATNGAEDYPTHGIHGVYMMFRAIVESGNPVHAVSYRADSWHEPGGVMTFEHRGKDNRPFNGTLQQTGGWGTIQIRTKEDPEKKFAIDPGSVYPYNKTQVWTPMLWEFEMMAKTGAMPQSYEQILNKNNIFLAGWRSILNNKGNSVRLTEVPDDWETPVALPNVPGDPSVAQFKRKFG